MSDLNMMMREQARNGLNAELDAAVTNGDAEAARKVTAKLEALAVSSAPKAPPYGQDEIKAALDKQPWFGIDPKRSARVIELGKHLDLKKFATAELFAAALVKAVDDEFKPAGGAAEGAEDGNDGEGEDGNDGEGEGDSAAAKPEKKPRRTDGPGEGDNTNRSSVRRTSGPWTKLSDAPTEVQKEIKRSADKFVGAAASKEQRDGFVAKALESHYAAHLRTKGKK